ncbi:MAG: biotin--[acetyl-CoA-carboxylase] ligase [Firmicutes bacterium]|jgi:BirA family biotin operon repressor/biotin-[acetyl-CoA-carboxylase] ligase|uniref:biotin--[biotin carboxyl-carrier protein] ligase n=1 Tax=Sulfobacillus benefaciens TaxID=453960 RepID=A0A2T2WRR9_9FIRM|nr:biotin--[acetyl-CoA-carboxylase] ligase [Bacillota bacterium]MCL5014326.1 biotin--[acetyl-CoA-carboxylase] ligase [Bacillota bacterium]PSR24931.1 MAG: biotin--[acetyl-CoA-carboxylase] ligase [Sulfobacillus benefaciens]
MNEEFIREEQGWIGQDITVLETVGSTNQLLRERLTRENVPPGAAILAFEQTQGRGRSGRNWLSPRGQGLYASVVLYPPRIQHGGILSLLAAVALTDAIREVTGLSAGLKWPNDGILDGKKYSGILVEAGTTPILWAIVGMGINVRGRFGADQFPHAITLEEAGAKNMSLESLWQSIAHHLEARYERWLVEGNLSVIEAWRSYTVTLGKTVVAQGSLGTVTGMAEDVDEQGRLLIRQASGLIPVSSGEVSIRASDGSYA